MTDSNAAQRLMDRIEILARFSEEPGLLVRPSFTEAMRAVTMQVAGWMREAGMSVRQDAICNLIGRYEGTGAIARTLVLGSHLDSVRDAGKFDGPLGVLTALACVERLHQNGRRLPFAVEVIAFTDEEGLRFHTSYLGSSAIAGTFNQAWLDVRDAGGITVAQAIRQAGGDPDAVEACRYRSEDPLGYCEVHIEQGPVLESLDLPVGVVGVIAGQNRANVTFKGMAGHAGTVPMRLRHDALCAAAEFILAVEHQADGRDGLVATVGQVAVQPGAGNVIPGQVALSLDVRHQDDTSRRDAYRLLQEEAQAIADRRGVALEWEPVQEAASTPCAPMLVDGLVAAIESLGYPVQRLSSGAGHDGVPLSHLTEIAMLFVRCKGGISHNPAESVTVADVAVAIEVLSRFLESR